MAKKKSPAKPATSRPPGKKSASKSPATTTKKAKQTTTKKAAKTPAKKKPAQKKTSPTSTTAQKSNSKKKATTPAKKKPAKTKPTPRSAAQRKESTVKPAAKRAKPTRATKTKPAASRVAIKNPPAEKSVEGYLSTLNGWRKDVVANLRRMIRKAAPESSESVKWSQPVYEHHGPFAWIKAHAKHVNLGFWRGVELPDPRKLLEGTGNKMRHIKLSSLKDATKKELLELVRVAAKLNEMKGNPTRSAKGKAKHK